MDKKFLLILISILVVLVFALIGVYLYQHRIDSSGTANNYSSSTLNSSSSSVVSVDTSNWLVFTNSADSQGASFKYPNGFTVEKGDKQLSYDWNFNSNIQGILLERLTIPKSFEPGTNFGDARLSFGYSQDPQALSGCLKSNYDVDQNTQRNIGGINFKTFKGNDAGAGNLYENTSYRAVIGDSCYDINLIIHSSQISNYPPELEIKAFDRDKVFNALSQIVDTVSLSRVLTNPQPISSSTKTITLDDNNTKIYLKVGDSFLLKLGDFNLWDVSVSDETVLSRKINVLVIKGAQGIYEAHEPGEAILTATGNPYCRQSKPACATPSLIFRLTIEVSQ